jgi:hypothetical protein
LAERSSSSSFRNRPVTQIAQSADEDREARPFITKPDPRFDLLLLEREKHGK